MSDTSHTIDPILPDMNSHLHTHMRLQGFHKFPWQDVYADNRYRNPDKNSAYLKSASHYYRPIGEVSKIMKPILTSKGQLAIVFSRPLIIIGRTNETNEPIFFNTGIKTSHANLDKLRDMKSSEIIRVAQITESIKTILEFVRDGITFKEIKNLIVKLPHNGGDLICWHKPKPWFDLSGQIHGKYYYENTFGFLFYDNSSKNVVFFSESLPSITYQHLIGNDGFLIQPATIKELFFRSIELYLGNMVPVNRFEFEKKNHISYLDYLIQNE